VDRSLPLTDRARTVLLGASNLRISLPSVIGRVASSGAGEILVACGHGRSYGKESSLLRLRRLPGILQCGLWKALEESPPRPTRALLTDIGNDLMYGAAAADVAGWIGECLCRLAAQGAEVVLTRLALSRLDRLRPVSYRLAQWVMFPGRDLALAELLRRAHDLDARLRRLAGEHGATLVEQPAQWYGLDPIHFRRAERRHAWERILADWPAASEQAAAGLPLIGAADYRLGGKRMTTPQPVRRLPGGATVSLY
jgi:hypothetical protein